MNLVIDGLIFETQKHGGISRIFHEILPRLSKFEPSIQIEIITANHLRQDIPVGPHIVHTKLPPLSQVLRTRFLYTWNTNVRKWQISRLNRQEKNLVWFSTFYTLPPDQWSGISAIFVYDMIHELYLEQFGGRHNNQFRKLKRQCVKEADKVLCISDITKKDLVHLYRIDQANLDVVHLSCSDIFHERNYQKNNLPFSKPFLLYIGARSYYKGFNILLEAYAEWERNNDVDLVVVSNNKWSYVEQKFIVQHSLQEKIHLLLNINDENLAFFYSNASAFVYPSLYEGFGIPILESMHCRCPLVASDILTTREIAKDVPYYFSPLSKQSLLKAIELAIDNGKDCPQVTSGVQRASQFSWDKTAQKFYEALCEIVS